MLKHVAIVTSIVGLGSIVSACSGEDGSSVEGNGHGGSNNGSAGTLNLGATSNSGGSVFGDGKHDGGIVPLTDEQVQAIQDGACAGWATEGEALPAVLELVV